MVSELARGLVAAGHDVVLYAAGDSTAPVPILYGMDTGVWDRVGDEVVELPQVMRGYEALAGCDVVHEHTVLGAAWALACGYDHVVTTCHSSFAERYPVGRGDGGALRVIEACSPARASHQ